MNPPGIKFSQQIGPLAVIEGSLKKEGERLEFELAMTGSISGPINSVLKRQVNLSDLESIQVKSHLFRKSDLEFTARTLLAFQAVPGSKGFKYSVTVEGTHKDAVSFVRTFCLR